MGPTATLCRLCRRTAVILLFTSCVLSASALTFKMDGFNVEFDDATTVKFLNNFCEDPGNLNLVLDGNGTFVQFNSSVTSSEVNGNTSQTYHCTLADLAQDLYAIQCASVKVAQDTFSTISNCTVQQLNDSCPHQCAYVWTSSVKGAPFLVDVGQCQRTEARFSDMCSETEIAQPVEDDKGPDPMIIISYSIIFLQTSIIVVFMGFMIYIDIW
ncbi:hypothetical protein Btru_055698 [Bulinus truncatus]|nr:hypothetical protein Btru_055698 [Bulinus truncatus]